MRAAAEMIHAVNPEHRRAERPTSPDSRHQMRAGAVVLILALSIHAPASAHGMDGPDPAADPIVSGRVGKALERLERMAANSQSANPSQRRKAAEAFARLEPAFEAFRAAPMSDAERSYKEKTLKQEMQRLALEYTDVIELGDAGWAVAALYRMLWLPLWYVAGRRTDAYISPCEGWQFEFAALVMEARDLHVENEWASKAQADLAVCGSIVQLEIDYLQPPVRFHITFDGKSIVKDVKGRRVWAREVWNACGGVDPHEKPRVLGISGGQGLIRADIEPHCRAQVNGDSGEVQCEGCD